MKIINQKNIKIKNIFYKNKIFIFTCIFFITGFILFTNKVSADAVFQGEGAFTSGAAALTVPVPATYQDGDVFLLFVETANQAVTTPSGWTIVTNSPQSTGTAAAAGGVRLSVFYKVVSGAQSSVSVADSGDHQTAIILGFRGIDTSNPIEISAGSVGAASASMSFPSVTTTSANALVILAAAMDTDGNSTATVSGWTNTNLTSITEQQDQTVNTGAGGGLAIATAMKTAAGSVGVSTATGSTAVTHAYMTIALKPLPVSTPTVTTQTTTNITTTSATGNGTVVSDGNSTITERGFVWKTSMDPTISDNKLVVSGTTGSFTSGITGLTQNTLYYVRAYATNSAGTSYGANDAFITPLAQVAPSVSLNTADLMSTNDTTPTLEMTATDVNGDNVQYQVQINNSATFSVGEKWVAMGDNITNTMAYSSDGINWTGAGYPFSNYGYGVAYNGSRWVAVGNGSKTIMYSDDGINWNPISSTIFSSYGYSVAWNGSMWVAVGAGVNSIAYSYDGITWTGLGLLFANVGYGIAWNGDKWVAVGQGTNPIIYSYDGINWFNSNNGVSTFTTYGKAIAWGNGMWVATGYGANSFAHSSDGINWTGDGTAILNTNAAGIAWNGTLFAATGNGTSHSLAYSYDGINWTGAGKTIFTSFGRSMAWNGSKFVATGSGTNSIAYSYDGINWTGVGTSVLGSGVGVASNSPVTLVPSISLSSSLIDVISSSNPGFLNTVNGADTQPFNSGEKVSYTVQSGNELTPGTYYWRARAIDPSGTNTYSDWTATRSFVITIPSVNYTQSAYKFFDNLDNADVGSVLSAQDNSVSLNKSGQAFRLRMLVHSGVDLALSGQNFKLQFSPKATQCDVNFNGENYNDVTSDTIIAYYNNFYPEDKISLISNINDPVHNSDAILNQSYVESNNFTNSVSPLTIGKDAKWDFSLYDKGVSSQSYCLRIVKADGSLLDAYSVIPEVTTVAYVNRGGSSVSSIENVTTPNAPTSGGSDSGGSNITPTECNDGIDNDGDTLVDINDPNCHLNGILGNDYVSSNPSETVSPVLNTGGGSGGGGSGDLGFFNNLLKSIFNLSSYKALKSLMLGSVFGSF